MTDEHVHMLFIIQRKKDNPELSKSSKCIFRELATKKQILERKDLYERVAEENNARVYVSASPRDLDKARKKLQHVLIDSEQGDIVNQAYSCIMKSPIKEEKKFVVDLDIKSKHWLKCVLKDIRFRSTKEPVVVETTNGYHVITEPFDIRCFEGLEFMDVQKDGLTTIEYLEMIS